MYIPKPFIILLFVQNIIGYYISSPSIVSRRNIISIIAKSPAIIPFIPIASRAENKPLTAEEMEEYNRLLKEAERIQKIIDLNINASKKLLLQDEENGLEKYIRENNIRKK